MSAEDDIWPRGSITNSRPYEKIVENYLMGLMAYVYYIEQNIDNYV